MAKILVSFASPTTYSYALIINTLYELQQMLQELIDESDNRGLKMNKSKTNVIMETDTPNICQQHSD